MQINRVDFGVGIVKCDNGYKAKNSDGEQGINNGCQMSGRER